VVRGASFRTGAVQRQPSFRELSARAKIRGTSTVLTVSANVSLSIMWIARRPSGFSALHPKNTAGWRRTRDNAYDNNAANAVSRFTAA
jgi:hypothetical protein